jgi:uncharacterized protein (TIGR00251 family)
VKASMKISETKDGTIIKVFVKPHSAKFETVIANDEILVFCTEDPVKGRVNKELVKEFSRLFHSKIEIVSGFTSKQKRLLIKGVGKSEVERLLRSAY